MVINKKSITDRLNVLLRETLFEELYHYMLVIEVIDKQNIWNVDAEEIGKIG